jgi:hypothetical protein
VQKAQAAQCGFTGPRWSPDSGLHYGFCVDRLNHGDDHAMTSETDIRMRDVAACEAKAAASAPAPAPAADPTPTPDPAPAASCGLAGDWAFVQDNGYYVAVRMKQDSDGKITGEANTTGVTGWSKLAGTFDDSDSTFKFTIYWNNGAIGRYRGFVQSDDFVRGRTGTVNFHGVEPVICDNN